jgi:hypothetical protein
MENEGEQEVGREQGQVSSVADPGCLSRIRLFPSRILINEFKYYPKKWFLSSRKYDPGCSSWIPDADFLPIPDPGVKKAPDPGSGSATLQVRIVGERKEREE